MSGRSICLRPVRTPLANLKFEGLVGSKDLFQNVNFTKPKMKLFIYSDTLRNIEIAKHMHAVL